MGIDILANALVRALSDFQGREIALDRSQPLAEQGVDSLSMLVLIAEAEQRLGRRILRAEIPQLRTLDDLLCLFERTE